MHELIERKPTSNGYCPVLHAGEYCRDSVDGLYHFCTPESGHYSADARAIKEGLTIVRTVKNGKIVEHLPEFACVNTGSVTHNRWTVRNGQWLEVK